MATQDSEKKSFWQTLPGIITGTAGIITAITGLIIALNQAGIFSKSAEDNNAEINVSTEAPKGRETSKTASLVEDKSVSTTPSKLEVQFSMTSIKIDSELQYKILESIVEPKDPQNSILTIKIRCLNDSRYDFAFQSSSFRLFIDDLPTAPLGYAELNELVESHSANDGSVAFEFPNNSKSLKFLIYQGDNKMVEIPLSLIKI